MKIIPRAACRDNSLVGFAEVWYNKKVAMVHYTLNPNDKPTPEMLAELERASKMPITYDEDCPELTEEQLERVRKIAAFNRVWKMRKPIRKDFDSDKELKSALNEKYGQSEILLGNVGLEVIRELTKNDVW